VIGLTYPCPNSILETGNVSNLFEFQSVVMGSQKKNKRALGSRRETGKQSYIKPMAVQLSSSLTEGGKIMLSSTEMMVNVFGMSYTLGAS